MAHRSVLRPPGRAAGTKDGKSPDAVRIAREILDFARSVLLVRFRYMDRALNELVLQEADVPAGLAVDGEYLYYDADEVIRFFTQGEGLNNHRYLHAVLHCVFTHFWNISDLNRRLWDLACDIAVEAVITDLAEPSLTTELTQQQKLVLEEIRHETDHMTAEVLYAYLRDSGFSDEKLQGLADLFFVDDHSMWQREEEPAEGAECGASASDHARTAGRLEAALKGSTAEEESGSAEDREQLDMRNGRASGSAPQPLGAQSGDGGAGRWTQIAREMEMSVQSHAALRGDTPGSLTQNLRRVCREKYDYTSFLKKFAVLGERTEINMEEFDYIFYSYGLTHYKNMPLIEPLEYRDTPAVRDLVVAIDTSASTSGELVQAFLQKTYNILQNAESFQRQFAVHIIQCDASIQETAVIRSREEFERYMATLQIHGLGGTDFRPVFEYVDEQSRNGAFTKLGGLIYFTDGYGTFPARPPAYNSAFVFLDDGFSTPDVPPWAMKLILTREQVEASGQKRDRPAASFLRPLS